MPRRCAASRTIPHSHSSRRSYAATTPRRSASTTLSLATAPKQAKSAGGERTWTKATIENPVKKAKYLKSFTLYVGGEQVYAKERADALERELRSLVGGGVVDRLHRHDTNPANNPQPPARQRS